MTLYHTTNKEIKNIDPLYSHFDTFLFFSEEECHYGHLTYKLNNDELMIIDPTDYYYNDDLDTKVLDKYANEIVDLIDVDLDTAQELLSERLDVWSLNLDIEAEQSWEIQCLTAQASRELGFDGCKTKDEHGISYMIDMEKHLSKIELIK